MVEAEGAEGGAEAEAAAGGAEAEAAAGEAKVARAAEAAAAGEGNPAPIRPPKEHKESGVGEQKKSKSIRILLFGLKRSECYVLV